MIRQLALHNYKCFLEASIPFGPLTLLVGANASGKSSVIQSLLLLRQSYLHAAFNGDQARLLLAGELINVGQAQEIIPFVYPDERIDFRIEDSDGRRHTFDFRDDYTAEDYELAGEVSFQPELNLFKDEFNYLCAERVGARLLYPMPTSSKWRYQLGVQGEYTAFVLANAKRSTRIANETLGFPGSSDFSLRFQVTEWMRTIIPNFEFSAEKLAGADQAQLRLGNRGNLNDLVRPTNIGFGLVYTLPIVVAALMAPAGSLLIVENPESHLHPASQSAMGRFLAHVAAAGVQVVIETHSDHILNGIRIAVKQALLDPDKVAINYFINPDERGPQRIIQPKMYQNGGIRPWPKGFFDQSERDLRKLL
jgi:predicted ATPase